MGSHSHSHNELPPKTASNGSRPNSKPASPRLGPLQSPKAPKVSMKVESPPLVCYGPPRDSTGALMSVLLSVEVVEEQQLMDSVEVSLICEVIKKRPFVSNCSECKTDTTVVDKQVLLEKPIMLKKGAHKFPYSYLVPGNLPATSDNTLSSITYYVVTKARPANGPESKLKQPIKLSRAVLPHPHAHRHSIRVFPPTNLSATVRLPSVVYPGSDFPVEIRLDGVKSKNNTRWRLRRTNWKIEENSRMLSNACEKHGAKFSESGKSLLHEDSRLIGAEELKSGWKSDFDTADGRIEMELKAEIPAFCKAACDVESANGVNVSHAFILEMIVAEEYAPTATSRFVTPTGAARVLRMQFRLCVTARPGMGISWDEEQPPMYENVPGSPPSYGHCEDMEEHQIPLDDPPLYENVASTSSS